MSEYPTESQRMSWNNDGMDPDWKPQFFESKIPVAIKLQQNLIDALSDVERILDKYSDEELKSDGMVLQIKIPFSQCLEIKKAIKEFKGF